jgi:hypothetical protein
MSDDSICEKVTQFAAFSQQWLNGGAHRRHSAHGRAHVAKLALKSNGSDLQTEVRVP